MMKRIIGFALFWVAVGMVINMLLDSLFVQILIIILLVPVSYTHLYQNRILIRIQWLKTGNF